MTNPQELFLLKIVWGKSKSVLIHLIIVFDNMGKYRHCDLVGAGEL